MIETFGGGEPQGGVFSFTTAASFNTPEVSDGQPVLEKKFGDWDETSENLGRNLPHISLCPGVHLSTSGTVSFQWKYGSCYAHFIFYFEFFQSKGIFMK